METLLADTWWVGGAVGVTALLLQIRRAQALLPLLTLAAVGVALWRGVLDAQWIASSLRLDPPWMLALLWALWVAQARSGWLRVEGWGGTVAAALIAGDLAAATSLVTSEPDPARRARLVLAASGASLIGLGGAASLLMGWGGPRLAALGIVLALTGFVPGPTRIALQRPAPRQIGIAAATALSVAICAALLVWLAAACHLLEFAALQIEPLPNRFPSLVRPLALLPAILLGIVTDEGAGALGAQAVLDRAFNIQGDWARQMSVAGLAVGGGLPLLLLSRSSLRVGLPLWALQVGLTILWAGWAWAN